MAYKRRVKKVKKNQQEQIITVTVDGIKSLEDSEKLYRIFNYLYDKGVFPENKVRYTPNEIWELFQEHRP